ncbi:MAG: sensor domain-containing diguanylate cyclase [Treponema sp.]|nr:sensor domain-containing diguanylate cyclase [Treponema sp.]
MHKKVISIIIITITSVIVSITIPSQILRKSQQAAINNKLLANSIYDELYSRINNSIIISQTIASDTFLKEILRNENTTDKKQLELKLGEYLTSIQNKFGYESVFIVSEKSHSYYTSKGYAKTVNPEAEPYDLWYEIFIKSEKEMSLDTNRDQENGYKWTIFSDTRITDSDGKLLGVCGVGIVMEDLQNIISEIEIQNNIKVNLINQNGLVQFDSDSANIKNAYISEALNDGANGTNFVITEKSMGGFRITRYIPEIQWYLTVQRFYEKDDSFGLKFMLVCIYFFLILLIIVTLWNKNNTHHEIIINDSNEDELTGLPNRNYLKDSFGELGIFNTTRYKSLIMFDIDRFKTATENTNGDKIILEVVNLAKKIIDEKGILFRWSGDEFVAFLEMDSEDAESCFIEFCKDVKDKLKVTVSVGIVEVSLSESIKTNYHRAVQQCYYVKEHGGNGVKRQK